MPLQRLLIVDPETSNARLHGAHIRIDRDPFQARAAKRLHHILNLLYLSSWRVFVHACKDGRYRIIANLSILIRVVPF